MNNRLKINSGKDFPPIFQTSAGCSQTKSLSSAMSNLKVTNNRYSAAAGQCRPPSPAPTISIQILSPKFSQAEKKKDSKGYNILEKKSAGRLDFPDLNGNVKASNEEFIPPSDFNERNKSLVCSLMKAMGDDKNTFDRFKNVSIAFRQDQVLIFFCV